MKIKQILVAIDFEKQTGHILAYASLFSEKFKASLHLFHVIDYLTTPPSYLDRYMEEEKRSAEMKLEEIVKGLSLSGQVIDARVIIGRLQASVETIADKAGADLLILGFVSHALRRSSSEKLIKGLEMPMLVVRGEKAEPAARDIAIRKILCPVDFSDISHIALRVSGELAERFSAGVEVMHVIPQSVVKKMRASASGENALEEVFEHEKRRFESFLSESPFEKSVTLDQGEPYKRIVEHARKTDIDLIVIGARGLGLIQGMLIGSVTDAVLKSAPCPVLVIH